MINQCFHYLPLDGGGREGLGVVVVLGPAVLERIDCIIIVLVNMIKKIFFQSLTIKSLILTSIGSNFESSFTNRSICAKSQSHRISCRLNWCWYISSTKF